MEVMKGREAESRKAYANGLEQCFVILLEARARECIGVASRKTQRKRVRATCEAQGMKMPSVTTIRPEAVVNYARPRRS